MLGDAFARLQGLLRELFQFESKELDFGIYRSLNLGGDERLPLYPFIVPMTCPDCGTEEVFFVDSWERRRNVAKMKSFEKGQTITDSGISDSLSKWGDPPG